MENLTVLNFDIAGLLNRMNRFIEECYKSVSSSGSDVNQFDKSRLIKYIDAIDFYHDFVIAEPQLDLPETTPTVYTVRAGMETPEVENEMCNDMIRVFKVLRDEMSNCQSARQSSGLIVHDSVRLRAMTERCRQYLIKYINEVAPLDMPESTPQEPDSGHGRRGILKS